ncbi:Uncharacterised protein [Mycobacteroides abscessus subsp. abscessus]|nr:hypothetical protein MA4S0206_3981 [Mycobacteroides abscessus 4S-0206]SHU47025.1 Uncharacterised protein [Mycobacteroides abscessus subsp. abscessus]SHX33299.1 Uncharacterised protein [Mycobacteroides abscessus subsp. abscessus]SIH45150.1 Uncharacterised protein [Mycobacteroides abscessus subsp. abscessus]SKM71249.1 Uncharacterised protein [Mycobacteroides abscessus subsp. abscessus]
MGDTTNYAKNIVMCVSPNNPPGITDTIYIGAHYVVYSEYTAALPRIARSVRSEAPKHPHEDFQPALNGYLENRPLNGHRSRMRNTWRSVTKTG